jgi:hypothetical protein
MNITLQVIESSKSKTMSLLGYQKIGIDNQGFRIINTKQEQTRILKRCKNLNS